VEPKAADQLTALQEAYSELKQAEKRLKDQLQVYARRIIQIQEEERKRIAYELHDDTAQYLSILKMQIDSLLQSGKIRDPEITQKLEYLKRDAERAFHDVRRYSHELRPTILEHQGLQAALKQMADDINKLQQITIVIAVEGMEPDLPEEIKLALFRIAQEALNNICKHAKASQGTVRLQYQGYRVSMTIVDNGTGFDAPKAIKRASELGSLGLASMQERAKLIGASFRIESKPGKGTAVSVELSR
jgi:signal transduction histidine kinase